MTLNYDMTFLVLLLSSLYEPKESSSYERCGIYPRKKHRIWSNKFTDYAADMTIALSYYKCLDDWQDEHRLLKLGYAKMLKPHYREIMLQYPRQYASIEKCFADLGELEKSGCSLPDATTNFFGLLMGSLFAYDKGDHWAEPLARTGAALGKFIYVMDACLDMESDTKHGRYNPLLACANAGVNSETYELLTMLIGDCTLEFEKLPLVQDIAIMRNVLYSGIWQKYQLAAQKIAKRGGK